jgi:hypothetical protein
MASQTERGSEGNWVMGLGLVLMPVVAAMIVGCAAGSWWWALGAALATPVAVVIVVATWGFLVGMVQAPTMAQMRDERRRQHAAHVDALAADFDLPNPIVDDSDLSLSSRLLPADSPFKAASTAGAAQRPL